MIGNVYRFVDWVISHDAECATLVLERMDEFKIVFSRIKKEVDSGFQAPGRRSSSGPPSVASRLGMPLVPVDTPQHPTGQVRPKTAKKQPPEVSGGGCNTAANNRNLLRLGSIANDRKVAPSLGASENRREEKPLHEAAGIPRRNFRSNLNIR